MERSTLTDLLPSDAARAVRRDYFLRLACVAAAMLALLLIAHGLLLIPTYEYLKREVAERSARSAQNVGGAPGSAMRRAASAARAKTRDQSRVPVRCVCRPKLIPSNLSNGEIFSYPSRNGTSGCTRSAG